MQWLITVVVSGTIVFMGGIWYVLYKMEKNFKQKTAEMLATFPSLGLHYEEHGDALVPWVQEFFDTRLDKVDMYGRESAFTRRTRYFVKAVSGVVRGEYRGYRFIRMHADVIDSIERESRDNRMWHTLVWVQLPVQVPYLELYRNYYAGDTLKSIVGMSHYDTVDEKFDIKLGVICKNHDFANAVLNPAVRSFVVDDSVKFQEVTFSRDHLGVYDNDPLLPKVAYDPDEIAKRLDVAIGIIERIPPHVWRR